jgi:hypothetical protein
LELESQSSGGRIAPNDDDAANGEFQIASLRPGRCLFRASPEPGRSIRTGMRDVLSKRSRFWSALYHGTEARYSDHVLSAAHNLRRNSSRCVPQTRPIQRRYASCTFRLRPRPRSSVLISSELFRSILLVPRIEISESFRRVVALAAPVARGEYSMYPVYESYAKAAEEASFT